MFQSIGLGQGNDSKQIRFKNRPKCILFSNEINDIEKNKSLKMNKKSEQINKQPTNLNRTNCGPFRLLEPRLQSLFFPLLCTSPPFLRITSVDPLLRSQRILLSPSPLCNASSHPTKNPPTIKRDSSFFLFLTYISHPSRPKFVSQKEKSPISFLLPSFFKSSNQKQSSQFQIPLQNLPRRVPPSLNSNGKFPCKNMKILKLNNCMNR